VSEDWGNDPLVGAQGSDHNTWGNDPIVQDPPRAMAWGPSSAWKTDPIPQAHSTAPFGSPEYEKFEQERLAKERAQMQDVVTHALSSAGSTLRGVADVVEHPIDAAGRVVAAIPGAVRSTVNAIEHPIDTVRAGGNYLNNLTAARVGDIVGSAAVGGAVGRTVGVLGEAAAPAVREAFTSAKPPLAARKVLEQVGKDQAAGGPGVTEVMTALNKAREAGKPVTLADVGGENVKALAGYVTRQPGEAMTTARNALATRDQGAASRLSKDIEQHITSGPSMKQTADALTQSRAAAARPLYEEAMKPGSTAPLQESLEAEFGRIQTERAAAEKELAAAERGVTTTAAKASLAGNVGDLAMRGGDARAAAQGTVQAAEAKLRQLAQDDARAMDVLSVAQRARASGERGGVWSPRLQQFLDDPIVKSGISKGLQVQRLEALAEGKPFNAADYAVTGTDKAGEPIVSKVPNMRLLDSAKRGLDEILEGYRDKTTGRLVLDQRGRAIDQVRQAFVGELDRLNPSYKAARASWSGPAQSLDAMKMGSESLSSSISPEQVAANFNRLSPNDKEFYRLGVADKLRERIAKTGVGGDEAKRVISNEWTKGQLRPIFDSQEQFDKFVDAVTMESKMFDTAFRLKGGSHTAERTAADSAFGADLAAGMHGAGAVKNALSARFYDAARDMWRMRQALGWRKNQAMNAEIAKILFDPGLTQDALRSGAGQRLLENFPGPQTQNFLSGARLRQLLAAPAAGAVAPQVFNQGPSQ
jgi:hypothetical protein